MGIKKSKGRLEYVKREKHLESKFCDLALLPGFN